MKTIQNKIQAALDNAHFFEKNFFIPLETNFQTQLKILKRNFIEDQYSEQSNPTLDSGIFHLLHQINEQGGKIRLVCGVYIKKENRNTLNRMLLSIKDNLRVLTKSAGILPHEFICFVFLDGLQNVTNFKQICVQNQQQKSMQNLFTEFEFRNKFINKEVVMEQGNNKDFLLNALIYQDQELVQLQKKEFKNIYKFYKETKEINAFCKDFFKNQKKYDDLNFPKTVRLKLHQYCKTWLHKNMPEIFQNFKTQFHQDVSIQITRNCAPQQVFLSLVNKSVAQIYRSTQANITSRRHSTMVYPGFLPSQEDGLIDSLQESEQNKFFLCLCPNFEQRGRNECYKILVDGFCKYINPDWIIFSNGNIELKENCLLTMWQIGENQKDNVSVVVPQLSFNTKPTNEDQDQEEEVISKILNLFFSRKNAQDLYVRYVNKVQNKIYGLTGYFKEIPIELSFINYEALKNNVPRSENYITFRKQLAYKTLAIKQKAYNHLYLTSAKGTKQLSYCIESLFQSHCQLILAQQIQNKMQSNPFDQTSHSCCNYISYALMNIFIAMLYYMKYFGLVLYVILINFSMFSIACQISSENCFAQQQSNFNQYQKLTSQFDLLSVANIIFFVLYGIILLLAMMNEANKPIMKSALQLVDSLLGLLNYWSISFMIYSLVKFNLDQSLVSIQLISLFIVLGLMFLFYISITQCFGLFIQLKLFLAFIFHAHNYLFLYRSYAYMRSEDKLVKIFEYLFYNSIVGISIILGLKVNNTQDRIYFYLSVAYLVGGVVTILLVLIWFYNLINICSSVSSSKLLEQDVVTQRKKRGLNTLKIMNTLNQKKQKSVILRKKTNLKNQAFQAISNQSNIKFLQLPNKNTQSKLNNEKKKNSQIKKVDKKANDKKANENQEQHNNLQKINQDNIEQLPYQSQIEDKNKKSEEVGQDDYQIEIQHIGSIIQNNARNPFKQLSKLPSINIEHHPQSIINKIKKYEMNINRVKKFAIVIKQQVVKHEYKAKQCKK